MSLRRFRNPDYGLLQGFDNFKLIFTEPVLKQVHVLPCFPAHHPVDEQSRWSFQLTLGLGLALVVESSSFLLKGLYKVLLVIPWAIPQVISCLTWRGDSTTNMIRQHDFSGYRDPGD